MTSRDPAAARFAAIQLVRWIGVAIALAGIAILAGRVPALAALPVWAGYVPLLAGLLIVFAAPVALARRWRSPPPP